MSISRRAVAETPPRAWGRLEEQARALSDRRNTPTGVGKTSVSLLARILTMKHPHGRGEDARHDRQRMGIEETPPRAWGRLQTGGSGAACRRNTPTGVGKTVMRPGNRNGRWKHPHGRGEDGSPSLAITLRIETPPRAWGRPALRGSMVSISGNTPTGVGKTRHRSPVPVHSRKHPHGRGEDYRHQAGNTCREETPPRAWGRLWHMKMISSGFGNTPTGVGKTPPASATTSDREKHPHGRGEDPLRLYQSSASVETPPRAWGRHSKTMFWPM